MSRGSIRPRGPGKWQVSAYVGYDPVTGNQRRTYRTVVGSKRAAERARTKLLAEVDAGGHRAAPGTVANLLDRWFELHADDWTPKTHANRQLLAAKHLLPTLGDRPAGKVTTADIDALYARLRRTLAPASIRLVHQILRGAYRQAVRWDEIQNNPALEASLPSAKKTTINPPTPEQIGRIIELADPVFAVFLTVAATTGARRGELCGLRWRHVDLDGAEMVIEQTKTGTPRRIALDSSTVDVLRQHKQAQRKFVLAAGGTIGPTSFVFSTFGGDPLKPSTVSHTFARLRDRAGLPPFRLHDVRHAVATQLLASGVDVRTVAGRLGHANPAVTLAVYAHFVPSADRKAADLAGSWLPRRTGDTG